MNFFLAFIAAFAIAILGLVVSLDGPIDLLLMTQNSSDSTQSHLNLTQSQKSLSLEERFPFVLSKGSTLSAELTKVDVSPQVISEIVTASKNIKDLAQLKVGTRFQIQFDQKDLVEISFRLNPRQELLIRRIDQKISANSEDSLKNNWSVRLIEKKVYSKVVTFKGEVQSTLWESAQAASMDARLISDLSEIFAWQVDFSREVKVGDKWRLSVEKEFVDSEFIGYGSILSAEYINVDEKHLAVLFRKDEEDYGYFTPTGESLQRIFLKSPIEFGRISSRFQKKRFHPVLKISRPHLGVDYAAPTGTPIRAIGDGQITLASYNGGGGNTIRLRHTGSYESAYKHLSRYAKGIRKGAYVQQGQVIGYVGSTGLSTGPHLHFEFFINGKFVDPLGQKFPQAKPLDKELLTKFFDQRNSFIGYLPDWNE